MCAGRLKLQWAEKNKLMHSEQIVPKLEHFRIIEEQHDDGNSILFRPCKQLTLSLPANKSGTCKNIKSEACDSYDSD